MTLAAVVAGLVGSNCTAQQPTFDVVSVKVVNPATAAPAATGGPGTNDPGRIHYGRTTLLELLMRAYDVATDQVVGPSWIHALIGADTYAIDATMSASTTKEQFRLMLQNMLAQRFHLVVHHETQDFPGYDLVVANGGPKFKEAVPAPGPAATSGAAGKDGFPSLPPGPQVSIVLLPGVQRVKYQERSMADFAYNLEFRIVIGTSSGYDLAAKRPRVMDRTGLTGKYDFILTFSCEGCIQGGLVPAGLAEPPAPDAPPTASATEPVGGGAPRIFEAVEEQLGLKLVKVKDIPMDMIVIDRVDKVPTAN